MSPARDEEYPPGSLAAEIQRICSEADAALPGYGQFLLAEWNERWAQIQEGGLRTAWEATK